MQESLEKSILISAAIPGYLLAELDSFAKKFGQNRSELVREAIATAVNKWRKEENLEVAQRTK